MQAVEGVWRTRRSDEQTLELRRVLWSAKHGDLYMHNLRTGVVARWQLGVAGVPHVVVMPLNTHPREANDWARLVMRASVSGHLDGACRHMAAQEHDRMHDDGELVLQVSDVKAAPFLSARQPRLSIGGAEGFWC